MRALPLQVPRQVGGYLLHQQLGPARCAAGLDERAARARTGQDPFKDLVSPLPAAVLTRPHALGGHRQGSEGMRYGSLCN